VTPTCVDAAAQGRKQTGGKSRRKGKKKQRESRLKIDHNALLPH